MQWKMKLLLLLGWMVCSTQADIHLDDIREAISFSSLDQRQAEWNAYVLANLPSFDIILTNLSIPEDRAISAQCRIDVQYYTLSLATNKFWAIKMMDASTKIPESVLSGLFMHQGNFDQCLDVTAPLQGDVQAFIGHYCMYDIKITTLQPSEFSLGLKMTACLPDTCTPNEIAEIVQIAAGPPMALVGLKPEVSVYDLWCYTRDSAPTFDGMAWFFISVMCILAATIIASTIFDFFGEKSENKISGAFLSFSLKSNMIALTNTQHSRGTVKCLHGLRVFSLLWVMFGHRYGNQLALPLTNLYVVPELVQKPLATLVHNALIAVDTFFVLSGFLVCYLFIQDKKKNNRPFNPFHYYIYRYFRLTTSLAMLIFFYVTVFIYVGNGPTWKYNVYWQVDLCKKMWWSTVLYLNNLVRPEPDPDYITSLCVDQSWYLTVDMQLFWLAPLILIPLWRWPKPTVRFGLPFIILASCFAPFTFTYIKELPMTQPFKQIGPNTTTSYGYTMYYVFWMRATPYLTGMALAYFMTKEKSYMKLPKWAVLCGWTASTIVAITVLLGPAVMYQPNYEYDRIGCAFYAGFHKLGWGLVICWVIFACSRGHGGPVTPILSWRMFLPLSRLAYNMYLWHTFILYMDMGTKRTAIYFTHYETLMYLGGDVFGAAFLAMIAYLCVEAPTLGLLRVLLRPSRLATSASADKDHQSESTESEETKGSEHKNIQN